LRYVVTFIPFVGYPVWLLFTLRLLRCLRFVTLLWLHVTRCLRFTFPIVGYRYAFTFVVIYVTFVVRLRCVVYVVVAVVPHLYYVVVPTLLCYVTLPRWLLLVYTLVTLFTLPVTCCCYVVAVVTLIRCYTVTFGWLRLLVTVTLVAFDYVTRFAYVCRLVGCCVAGFCGYLRLRLVTLAFRSFGSAFAFVYAAFYGLHVWLLRLLRLRLYVYVPVLFVLLFTRLRYTALLLFVVYFGCCYLRYVHIYVYGPHVGLLVGCGYLPALVAFGRLFCCIGVTRSFVTLLRLRLRLRCSRLLLRCHVCGWLFPVPDLRLPSLFTVYLLLLLFGLLVTVRFVDYVRVPDCCHVYTRFVPFVALVYIYDFTLVVVVTFIYTLRLVGCVAFTFTFGLLLFGSLRCYTFTFPFTFVWLLVYGYVVLPLLRLLFSLFYDTPLLRLFVTVTLRYGYVVRLRLPGYGRCCTFTLLLRYYICVVTLLRFTRLCCCYCPVTFVVVVHLCCCLRCLILRYVVVYGLFRCYVCCCLLHLHCLTFTVVTRVCCCYLLVVLCCCCLLHTHSVAV